MTQSLNPIERTYRLLVANGKSPIKLFSGNPNEHGFHFPELPLLSSYGRFFRNHAYQPHPKGLPDARRSIADYYFRRGASVDPEHIILTSGTSEAFLYLFSLLTAPGENILSPNPAYPLFEHIAELTRTELKPYPLRETRNWEMDLDALKLMADDKTRAVLLVSPNNPTGAVVAENQIEDIIAWCNERSIALICDEVFSEFYFGPKTYPRPMTAGSADLCFTLNGISKMFALPALKLSWIAATGKKAKVESVVDRLETTADAFLSCHTPIQYALPELFAEGESFLEYYRDEVCRRLNLAVDLLRTCRHVSFTAPEGGFYLTVKVEKNLPYSEEEWVIRLMKEKNIFVHPGYFYDYEDGIHFVISILTQPQQLRKGIEGIIDFLDSPASVPREVSSESD